MTWSYVSRSKLNKVLMEERKTDNKTDIYYTTRKSERVLLPLPLLIRLKKSGFRYVKMEESFSDSRESMEMVLVSSVQSLFPEDRGHLH